MMLTNGMMKEKTTGSRSRAATLVQVAEKAGVNPATASVVLNASRTGTRVSKETRARILEVARELHYSPNVLARSLRTHKTHVIAFYNALEVAFDPRYPFYAAILAGIQAGCKYHQKDLLLHANFAGRSDDDIFNGLHNGQIDGLVLFARSVTPLVERLVESRLPVVTVAEEVPGVPYVGIDEQIGGQLLARHLAAKGYKSVHYRGIREEPMSATQQQRQKAFCDEARSLGLNVTTLDDEPKSNSLTSKEQALLLQSPQARPEVMVCWSDASAERVMAFCREKGVRIPQDVAVTGFDGLVRYPSLPLTTIAAPWFDVARTAVGLLSKMCEGDEVQVPQRTILPVELLEGDTT